MGLTAYQKKRDFRRTAEPKGEVARTGRRRFVVQEHHASTLHFDFRLEMGGVLKSWAVRKGPSLDPAVKRLAVTTEDHPIAYLKFQGTIPEGSYGAGEHRRWDIGTYELLSGDDPLAGLDEGKLKIRLHGEKLKGEFNLIRLRGEKDQWLLIKGRDEYARPGWQLQLLIPDDEGNTKIANDKAKAGKRRIGPHSESTGKAKRTSTTSAGRGKTVTARKLFSTGKLAGEAQVKVGRKIVSLTHLDKLYYPEEGFTKGDLLRYYYEVSHTLLPYLKDRPLILKRYPNGIDGKYFHQHDVDEAPDYVRTIRLDVVEGHKVDYIVCDNLQTLLYLTNIGAIERHPWHSRIKKLDCPDYLVFDLDPGKGVEFSAICEIAVSARNVLERLGLQAYAKTSGSRGIHIYVPIRPDYDYKQVADFARQAAGLIAGENPAAATVERSLGKRKPAQIYVDHMQNARGKSIVAPYSVRPRPGATVSAPLEWGEVKRKKITPQDFTINNMLKRLERKGDLFKEVLTKPQRLEEAIENLAQYEPKRRTRV